MIGNKVLYKCGISALIHDWVEGHHKQNHTQSIKIDNIKRRKMEQLNIRQLIGETTEYDKKLALEVRKPKS